MIPPQVREEIAQLATSVWDRHVANAARGYSGFAQDSDPYVMFILDAEGAGHGADPGPFEDRIIAKFVLRLGILEDEEERVQKYSGVAEQKFVEITFPHGKDSGVVVHHFGHLLSEENVKWAGCVISPPKHTIYGYQIAVDSSGKDEWEDHFLSFEQHCGMWRLQPKEFRGQEA